MKLITAVMLGAIFGAVATADDANQEHSRKAIEQAVEEFSGVWEIVSVAPKGVAKDAAKLVFRKDGTYAALNKDGENLWGGTYDLDPTVTPKVWNHRSYDSLKNDGDALGIYEINGDKLRACCVVGTWKDKEWLGKPRPKEFKLSEADAVLEMRRVSE